MKKYALWFLVILMAGFTLACSSKKQITEPGTSGTDAALAEADTVEYELLIIDPAFETWFRRNQRPENYYSLEYLENWNRQLVMQWNMMLGRQGRPDCMPTNYIEYDPDASYGLTLNHKLFYYFRFLQQRCRIFSSFPRN